MRYLYAESSQIMRKKLAVRVGNIAEQKVGADGDDFSVHEKILSFLSSPDWERPVRG